MSDRVGNQYVGFLMAWLKLYLFSSDLIENAVLPRKLEDLLRDCTAVCLTCGDKIYTSAFPVIYEEYIDPKRFMGFYLGFYCSWNCRFSLPVVMTHRCPVRVIPVVMPVIKRHCVFEKGPT